MPCKTTAWSTTGRSAYVPSRIRTVSAPESMAIWTVGYASGTTTELARTGSTARIPQRSRAQTLQTSGLDNGNLTQGPSPAHNRLHHKILARDVWAVKPELNRPAIGRQPDPDLEPWNGLPMNEVGISTPNRWLS